METKNLHYEFTGETIDFGGITLHRIRATKDLPQHDVKTGDLGGWVEKESNLRDNAWVGDNAKVYGNARVFGDAKVCENARVFENAIVFDEAEVCGNAKIFENARVCENAIIFENAKVFGNAEVLGDAEVYGNAKVYGCAIIYGNAEAFDEAEVHGDAEICKKAEIQSTDDLCVFSHFGSRKQTTTFFKTEDGDICVVCGCFEGTLEKFVEQVKETHGDNIYAKEYLAIVEVVKIKFNL